MKTVHLLSTLSAVALAATLGQAAVGATTAGATSPSDGPPGLRTVATGLDNPRHLSIANGAIYVAEAGTGGSGPCIGGAEGEACYGTSGAITKVTRRGSKQVVRGLPSLAAPDGSGAIGPTDVLVSRHRWIASIGLGNLPEVRDELPPTGRRLLGTVATGKLKAKHHGKKHRWHASRPRVIADLAAYEQANDPDGAGPDSNPGGIAWTRHGLAAADAGANAVLNIRGTRRISVRAVLDSPGTAPAPFPPFDEIPMQPVPTSVAVGPDGALYVSELTGFPFAPGAARIHRISKSGQRTVWATGLTNVTDLAWHRGKLYAVQLADEGLLAAGEEVPMGSLVKVVPGQAPQTVVDALPAPYGVAFSKNTAYLTTCAVCPGGGSVVAAAVR